jgi:hypothetical protein
MKSGIGVRRLMAKAENLGLYAGASFGAAHPMFVLSFDKKRSVVLARFFGVVLRD